MYASLQALAKAANLSPESTELLMTCISEKHALKGSLLIQEGQRCEHIYIIESGFARIYTVTDDKDVTTLFARENDIITSTYSLFTKNVSQENIELLEDTLLLKINYSTLVSLCEQHTELFAFYRFTMERYYLSLEERTMSLQFDRALERYRKLLLRHPFILQRSPLGHVASYLGMSPVTLSRMRGEINKL